MAIFYTSVNVAGTLGGLVAYGIDRYHDQIAHSWRWLIGIEAIPAFIGGILTIFFLPDFPQGATFLKDEDKEFLLQELQKQGTQNAQTDAFDLQQFLTTLVDWQTW